MQKEIQEILNKYENIDFTYEKDKNVFFEFINTILKNNLNEQNINDLSQIIENSFIKYSKFDNKILYNPIELIDSIIENDIKWLKIDDDEFEKIAKKFNEFEKYLKKELDDKDYLEKKYNIKINLITWELSSISAWIFGMWLNELQKVNIIKKLKKLLDFYPINFIQNIKLNSIVVVNYFYKQDIYWTKIMLWWFETLSDNNIYLSSNNLVKAFDHELYHQAMQYYDDFQKWMEIRKNQDKKYLYEDIENQTKWFARNYWKENIWEDQATVAEELILNYNDIQERAINDKILEKKVQLVKQAFFKLSDEIMDEKFWEEKFKI